MTKQGMIDRYKAARYGSLAEAYRTGGSYYKRHAEEAISHEMEVLGNGASGSRRPTRSNFPAHIYIVRTARPFSCTIRHATAMRWLMWHKGMELDGKSMKVGDFLRLRGTEPYRYVHLTRGDLDRLMAMPRDADVWFWEYEFDGDWYDGMGSVSNARIEVDWAETEAHNHGK